MQSMQTPSPRRLPLAGIRVVDLTSVLFGPYAAQILGDYGADVIKVESPEGDSTRRTGPGVEAGMSPVFLGANRNKRSAVLDLKQPAARQALLALVDAADVFMHSVRPQKLPALGLDAATLTARRPSLVYAGLHGFRADGPYGGQPAYDDIVQGLSGVADLMQRQTGEPRYLPTAAADKICGLVAAHAILAAIAGRERSGRGCVVEVPMFESMVAFNFVEHFYGRHFDPPTAGAGYPRVLAAWRRPYRTLDGHVCMMPYTDAHWRRFFDAVGRADLCADPRFGTIDARTRHVESLYDTLSEIASGRSTSDWIALCLALEIPAAPVSRLDALESDPHLRATGFFETLHDPGMGTLRFPGVPVTFDGAPPPVAMPPRLGEHTREILAQAGLPQAAIDEMIRTGAARQWRPD
jgi:crotonobetainyl-CoA:carnitine CoA-transferase CaiB-like acyl-CoA transferase